MSYALFIGGPITNLNKQSYNIDIEKLILHFSNIAKNSNYQIFSAHIEEEFGRLPPEDDSIIVERDLRWIDQANTCLFLFPANNLDEPIRTDGTCIELGYALAQKKKIFVAIAKTTIKHCSPMLRGVLRHNMVRLLPLDQVWTAWTILTA